MSPSFKARSELTRHVDEDQRLPKSRPAHDVFVANPGASHLSVHTLELETLQQVAVRYLKRQGGEGEVAMCIHKVFEYNGASRNTAGQVSLNRSQNVWEFADVSAIRKAAYLYRPAIVGDSHCGVEYVRALNETEALRVARRLAKRKYRIV